VTLPAVVASVLSGEPSRAVDSSPEGLGRSVTVGVVSMRRKCGESAASVRILFVVNCPAMAQTTKREVAQVGRPPGGAEEGYLP
jgi:hypothetical protein